MTADTGTRPTAPSSGRTPCPRCAAEETALGTLTDRFVYLRCGACAEVWSVPERRAWGRARTSGELTIVPSSAGPQA